jgi:RecB family exonuclease
MTFLRDRALSRFESKTEVWGSLTLSRAKLSAKADRVDVLPGGAVSLIDYKTSSVPSLPQVRTFQQQMPLTALIAARGGFTDGRKAEVEEALIQSLSAAFKATAIPSEDRDPDTVAVQLEALLSRFDRDDGAWPARLRPEALSFAGDYDHLARRGEWDDRAMWFGYGDRDGAADG